MIVVSMLQLQILHILEFTNKTKNIKKYLKTNTIQHIKIMIYTFYFLKNHYQY